MKKWRKVLSFYPADGSDSEAIGALIFGGIGGSYQTTPKFASGIYAKNGYIYPQFWTTTSSKFTYSLNTNLKLVPTTKQLLLIPLILKFND